MPLDVSALAEPASASRPVCPLCCEEVSSPDGVVLSACRHRSCRGCLVRWIEREESSGQTTPPTCPFCRSTIGEDDVLKILGRPFQPREALDKAGSGDGEIIDELTLQWLNEHTVECGGCGYPIEKESGCDLMECLCGYRFCYKCHTAGAACNCNNRNHIFLSDECFLNDRNDNMEPLRDGNGQVDMRLTIQRREIREERLNRKMMHEDETSEYDYASEANPSVCTRNGRWLFAPNGEGNCVSMLAQQLDHERVGDERCERCWEERRRDRRYYANDASWLFLRRGTEFGAMRRLLRRGYARRDRGWRRRRREREVAPRTSVDLSWLFCDGGRVDCRLLRHLDGICDDRCELCSKEDGEACLESILFVFPRQCGDE